jgi:hypothetical protein
MYHVFRDLADWKDGRLVEATATEPLLVDGLVLKSDGTIHVLLANLTPRPQRTTVGPFQAGQVRVRQLSEETAPEALADPERFRGFGTVTSLRDGRLSLELPPYAVARIDEA